MVKKSITSVVLTFILCLSASAQSAVVKEFAAVSDSLTALLKERTTVSSKLKVTNVLKRDGKLDFYMSEELSDFPWTDSDVRWFKNELKNQLPAKYKGSSIGEVYSKGNSITSMITPSLGNNGQPVAYKYTYKDPRPGNPAFITEIGAKEYAKGLSGRYIALWQSHGRYYEAEFDRWEWQRAPVHTTVEDMYTQSYVLPFLIPMLENAGAYVMTPRERDIQVNEVVTDNDPAFKEERTGLVRKAGTYSESGSWTSAGAGFADAKLTYSGEENPFTMGTARQAECNPQKKNSARAEAKWVPDVPQRGNYAVYISYKSLPNSTEQAHYTVRHMNGATEFTVNQKIGGGTWIYLGTFEFDKGTKGYVTLDNLAPEGGKMEKKTVVTADAVRLGGGMGKIARGLADADPATYRTSGMPAYAEGALYSMQWSGVDASVHANWDDDYTKDYAARGAWVKYMKAKGIPFDLSLAFHSDAGTTPDDGIIGSLSIYTLLCDGSTKMSDGKSRYTCRHLADLVQAQICDDVRSDFEPEWSKRQLWDRSYSESRTTDVPGMLLELLSHQNFADMKYGLDPTFRFTVSRAIYKGMLKFLSDLYKTPYIVQPLPVNSFAVKADAGKARLSWKATVDAKEPTASSDGFILYTRVDDGAFDQGIILDNVRKSGDSYQTEVKLEKGHLYSFKIVAFNDGGKSFPSEVLCAGIPSSSAGKVMVVNNFDRVSAPTWFDTAEIAGFDGSTDAGVPYGYEINYIGRNYQYRRDLPWMDDDNPGFGASYSDKAGTLIPGNTFDFVRIHGKALMDAGYSFESASRDAFTDDASIAGGTLAIDLLCGKQVTTKIGRGAVDNRFQVFPGALRSAISSYTSGGGNIIISGANIGTDVWDEVYPVVKDSLDTEEAKKFVSEVLGYKWLSDHGSYTGEAAGVSNAVWKIDGIAGPVAFWQEQGNEIYCVENPDGIVASDGRGATIMKYTGNEVSAAVASKRDGYKVMSFGFPLECVKNSTMRKLLFTNSLKYFTND